MHNSLITFLVVLLYKAKVMITAKKVMITRMVISFMGRYVRIIIAIDRLTESESKKKNIMQDWVLMNPHAPTACSGDTLVHIHP